MSARPQQQQGGGRDRFADYITVSERIDKFYEKHPEGRIITQIIEHDMERGFVLIKASVYRQPDDAEPSATGHAYELKSEGHVQKTSYVEVCETSAVGRALAMLNFETKRGIVSREEMQKAARMGGELRFPAVKPAPVAEYNEKNWRAGESAEIDILAQEEAATARCGLSRNDLRDWIEKRHNTRAIWTLDRDALIPYRQYLKGLK